MMEKHTRHYLRVPIRWALRVLEWPAGRLALGLAILAMALALPTLRAGRVVDDEFHQLVLSGSNAIPCLPHSIWRMFNFADGDPDHNLALMDLGRWPWWAFPRAKAAMCRPVSVLTHALDYSLWPDNPMLMHAQSILWFGLLVFATTLLYRRLIPHTLAAGLAALLYAVDDSRIFPVGFLAGRNALIATFFGVLTVLAHDTWRRDGRRIAGVAAPFLLLAGLLSCESGIATTAYLTAYAVVLDRENWRRRALSLAPYVGVVVAWRVVWSGLGYGVSGIGFYVDPLAEPLRFSIAALQRGPVLLLGQFALPPSDLYIFAQYFGLAHVYSAIAVLLLAVAAWMAAPAMPRDATSRFWLLGMVLALPPACATFPADRMLTFVGLGAFALAAGLCSRVFWPAEAPASPPSPLKWPRRAAILAAILLIIHAGIAPLVLFGRSFAPVGPRNIIDKFHVDRSWEQSVARQSVVIVTAPIPLLACQLPLHNAVMRRPIPAHTRVLSSCDSPSVQVRRLDARTLSVRPSKGFMSLPSAWIARGPQCPMKAGERVQLTGMTAEVVSLTADERPAEVHFRFDVPLEDASLKWLYWKGGWFDGEFVVFTPPAPDP